MIAHIIKTTDTNFDNLEEVEIPNNKFEAMLTIRETIGGYMEFCTCHIENEPYYILCDDNGKLKGKPVNVLATSIYDYNGSDTINGDVILLDADTLLDLNNLF